MKPISNELLLQQLQWRYATKKFDSIKKISPEDWHTLEEALLLTPSSFGLQPWRFYVVTDPHLRQKLVPISWGQTQVVDASHLVVFAVKKDLTTKDVDIYLQRIVDVRKVSADSLKTYRDMMVGFVNRPRNEFDIVAWATRQVYIALGNFMTSAALLGIDTCPMEGIEPAKYDEALGLGRDGYQTVVVCPAGYRASDDKYASLPKVRFKRDDVIQPLAASR